MQTDLHRQLMEIVITMTEQWQPIETAPRDGTVIIVTDGERFAAADAFDYVEPATVGYGPTERPNPKAGQVEKLWSSIGCSAFSTEPDLIDDGMNVWQILRPTHWMPLPKAPQIDDRTVIPTVA